MIVRIPRTLPTAPAWADTFGVDVYGIFAGLSVADQELLIPAISGQLVRDEDDRPGQESYPVWFLTDARGSLICSPRNTR